MEVSDTCEWYGKKNKVKNHYSALCHPQSVSVSRPVLHFPEPYVLGSQAVSPELAIALRSPGSKPWPWSVSHMGLHRPFFLCNRQSMCLSSYSPSRSLCPVIFFQKVCSYLLEFYAYFSHACPVAGTGYILL